MQRIAWIGSEHVSQTESATSNMKWSYSSLVEIDSDVFYCNLASCTNNTAKQTSYYKSRKYCNMSFAEITVEIWNSALFKQNYPYPSLSPNCVIRFTSLTICDEHGLGFEFKSYRILVFWWIPIGFGCFDFCLMGLGFYLVLVILFWTHSKRRFSVGIRTVYYCTQNCCFFLNWIVMLFR